MNATFWDRAARSAATPRHFRTARRTTGSALLLTLLAILGVLVSLTQATPAQAADTAQRLCHDLALGGKCVDVRGGSDVSLVGTDTDDRTTSLEMTDPHGVLTLWQHPNRGGRCQSFRDQRVDDLRGSYVGDDTASWAVVRLQDPCKDPDAPPPGPVRGSVKGGTVCRDLASTGRCTDAYDERGGTLVGSYTGDNMITSLRSAPGQSITLFADPGRTGACQTFGPTAAGQRVDDLRGTWFGDDRASSYGVGASWAQQCAGSGQGPRKFEICGGERCDMIDSSVPDMSRTWIGDDRLEALYLRSQISERMSVALYSDPGFEGTCLTSGFTRPGDWRVIPRTDSLSGRISSIRLGHSCEQDPRLCQESDLRGPCISVRTNKAALRNTDVGDNKVSSIFLPKGWRATFYQHEDFAGVYDEVPNLLERLAGDGPWTVADNTLNFNSGWLLVHDNELSSVSIEAEHPCNAFVDPACRNGF